MRPIYGYRALMVVLAAVLVWSCGQTSRPIGGTTAVTLAMGGVQAEETGELAALQVAPLVVNAVRFTISGADMADITRTVTVAPGETVAETFDVPNGMERLFMVEALDQGEGQVYYQGSSTADLTGEPVTLPVSMHGAAIAESLKYFDFEGNVYWVTLAHYDDPNVTTESVVVTGPGIDVSLTLTFGDQMSNWRTGFVSFGYLDAPPAAPLTYTFTITESTGTRTVTEQVECFMEEYAIPVEPLGDWTGTNPPQTYIWNSVGYTGVRYQVTAAWWQDSPAVVDTYSVAYTDTTPLFPGYYGYNIYASPIDADCSSAYPGFFIIP